MKKLKPEFLNFYGAQGIDSKESIPPAHESWRTSLQADNPIPTQFLAPIDCLKLSALKSNLLTMSI